jgi:uncharacterized membrane protein
MSASTDPILFEAISTPPQSLSRQGMIWLCALAVPAAAIPAVLFALLGAWPVLGFMGIEVGVVLGLVALHRRWSAAAVERLCLTEGQLSVTAADGRGGRRQVALDPYWSRVELREEAGLGATLWLVCRGQQVEVGRLLAEPEKRDLAEALAAALRRYRNPVFDNPQLG